MPTRTNSAQLNNLNFSYMEGVLAIQAYNIEGGSNKPEVATEYKKVSKDETTTYVFQTASDAQTSEKRENLEYINDVIQQFGQENPDGCKLLIPLMQSRLWKDHCVLVEVTITKDKKQIHIHDSQSWWRNIFYPNCLKDLKGFQVEYTSYAKQKDNYSCAYFVYQFIQKILGNIVKEPIKAVLKNSKFDSLDTLKNEAPNEEDPIGKLINDNFTYPNTRKIASGETIPWNQEQFISHFNKQYTQTIKDEFVLVDFEDDAKTIKLHESKENTGISFFQVFSNIDTKDVKNVQKITYTP